MEMNTMMKVVIRAMCSSSGPGPPGLLEDRDAIWPLYSINNILGTLDLKSQQSTTYNHLNTRIALCHARTMMENLTCLNLIFLL